MVEELKEKYVGKSKDFLWFAFFLSGLVLLVAPIQNALEKYTQEKDEAHDEHGAQELTNVKNPASAGHPTGAGRGGSNLVQVV